MAHPRFSMTLKGMDLKIDQKYSTWITTEMTWLQAGSIISCSIHLMQQMHQLILTKMGTQTRVKKNGTQIQERAIVSLAKVKIVINGLDEPVVWTPVRHN